MGKRSSVVWQQFETTEGGFNCTIANCPDPFVASTGSSTTGQWNHLEKKHPDIYNELQDQKLPPKRKVL